MFGLSFHHIGIACADIDRAAEFVRQHYVVTSDSGPIFDPVQNANVRLFNEGQSNAIELIAGPAVSRVVQHQITYYHVCYATPTIELTVIDAQRAGMLLVSPPKNAILFGGRRVAFVFTLLGLVEFLEVA